MRIVPYKRKKYDYVILIGRFQPAHDAHIQIIERGAEIAEKIIILYGSSFQARSPKNPWTWQERRDMIESAVDFKTALCLIHLPIRDHIEDEDWVLNVQEQVDSVTGDSHKIAIIGYKKDKSSYYLEMFPQWDPIEVENIRDLHAKDIRRELFVAGDDFRAFDEQIGRKLPKGIHDYLKAFTLTPEFETVRGDFEYYKEYDEMWANTPYGKPVFTTVDAVIVQSGHLLLVRRGVNPGKGLYALPGGFLNGDETLIEGSIRETREETGLKVVPKILKGSIQETRVFDQVGRSLRGRTITHAFYIKLPPGPLSKVKGADDAEKAKWVPFSTVAKMENQFFEDHYRIISYFIKL